MNSCNCADCQHLRKLRGAPLATDRVWPYDPQSATVSRRRLLDKAREIAARDRPLLYPND